MCVYSAIGPAFEPTIPPLIPNPGQHPITVPATVPWGPLPNGVTLTPEQLRAVLEAFHAAASAAKAADKAAGQPDCTDPDKVKLEARVAELERRLDAIAKALQP